MAVGLIQGEYRQHPLCPVAAPCVPCPVVVDARRASKTAAWVSAHSCHCCPNLIELTIAPDRENPVTVICRAAQGS